MTPSRHSDWEAKSRPGRYSESVNAVAGTPRISPQYSIHARAWAGRVTGIAPREPLPVRIRHHFRGPGSLAKISGIASRFVTSNVNGARTPHSRRRTAVRYLSWHV